VLIFVLARLWSLTTLILKSLLFGLLLKSIWFRTFGNQKTIQVHTHRFPRETLGFENWYRILGYKGLRRFTRQSRETQIERLRETNESKDTCLKRLIIFGSLVAVNFRRLFFVSFFQDWINQLTFEGFMTRLSVIIYHSSHNLSYIYLFLLECLKFSFTFSLSKWTHSMNTKSNFGHNFRLQVFNN